MKNLKKYTLSTNKQTLRDFTNGRLTMPNYTPLLFKIKGNLNTGCFIRALNTTLNKHQILSGKIEVNNNEPYIEVPEKGDLRDYLSVIELSENCSETKEKEFIENIIHNPVKVNQEYILQASLTIFTDKTFLAFHILKNLLDPQSIDIFLSDLGTNYNRLVSGQDVTNLEVAHPFFDYVKQYSESNALINSKPLQKDLIDKFKAREPLEFPYTYSSKRQISGQNNLKFAFSGSSIKKLKEFSNKQSITPFETLLAVWATFLFRITNQGKFIIGIPYSNRPEKYKNTIGCFTHTLPITFDFSDETNFIEIIQQVQKRLQNFQNLPLQPIKGTKNDEVFTHPIPQTTFSYFKTHFLDLTDLTINQESVPNISTDASELSIQIEQDNDHFLGIIGFNTNKFDIDTIRDFSETYLELMNNLLVNNTAAIETVELTPSSDIKFIQEINDTSCTFEDQICLHQKFEIQVDKTPEALAISSSSLALTYQETENHANRLANHLISKGIKKGDVVAICCERSPEMMLSILAILKTGAAYLPLHLDNPSDRMQVIIDDAKPVFVLSSKHGSRNIENKSLLIRVDKLIKQPLSENNLRPNVQIKSNELAYILYTSGSTGAPKGTLIEHRSVMNRIGWMHKKYPLNENDVILQKTPITFDVSVWELFWWFFNGSKQVLLKHEGEKDPDTIIKYVHNFKVTRMHFVPSMFTSFLYALQHSNKIIKLKSLNTIFLSGESLPAPLVNDFNELRNKHQLPQLVNLYGPTEATVDVSYYNCPNLLNENDKIYIGKPIDNTELYIVNSADKLQPVNVKGELLIVGVNLSRGYLNREELTNKSFIKFIKPNGSIVRAYKTGDVCVLRKNGEIEYIGRSDNQIKIRGLRIELGEIEAKILQHPNVKNVSVIDAFEAEKKAIIGYIELGEGQLSEGEIRVFLSNQLPDYMVPSYFVFLERLPINMNGKTDKKALPLPDINLKKGSDEKPIKDVEIDLCRLWSEILGVDSISINDNFFDIGGNSLLCIKLSIHINKFFKVNTSVLATMEYPNIKEYFKYLKPLLDKTEYSLNENLNIPQQRQSRRREMMNRHNRKQ